MHFSLNCCQWQYAVCRHLQQKQFIGLAKNGFCRAVQCHCNKLTYSYDKIKNHTHTRSVTTMISVPASIIFITLLWIGKKTVWLWAMWWCWNFFIVFSWSWRSGSRLWLCTIGSVYILPAQKIRSSCCCLFLWCN